MNNPDSGVAVCALPAEMTIAHAAELREALLHAVGVGQKHFDAQAVDSIDSSGIQLLLSLQRSLQGNGVSMTLGAPSAALLDALRLYGLGDLTHQEH
ncbi:MAG: STAS domain-containing protein [Pseudomonadota bacterium]